MDAPTKLIELSEALIKIKGGKTAGPDGIPVDIYKAFKEKLLPPLLEMVQETFEKGCLPPTLQSALIMVILKSEKTLPDVIPIDPYHFSIQIQN